MWYIVHVGAGNEAHMKEVLDDFLPKGLVSHIFYPLYESSYKKGGVRRIVTKVMLPGYLFLDMEQPKRIGELEKHLEKITEYHCLLTTGRVCTPVGSGEQTFLTMHIDSRHVMTMSRGYMVDRNVTITEGAFAGYCGKLKYVDRHNRYGVMPIKLGEREVDLRFGLEIIKREST